jgi:hypothetical protein
VGRRQCTPRFRLYKMRTMSARLGGERQLSIQFEYEYKIFTFTMVHALMDLSRHPKAYSTPMSSS